jgi:hypothetical protein
MNFKLKKIHLFVILLIALIGCCIQMPQFNLGFNLGFKEGMANDELDKTPDAYLLHITKNPTDATVDGTYPNLGTTSSGSGTLATVDVIITNGTVTSLTIKEKGSDYKIGESITVDGSHFNSTENLIFELVDTSADTTTDTTAAADTEEGKSSFQEEGRMNPLVLFNTMVNGESNSSITEIKDSADEDVAGATSTFTNITMQNRDLMGSPINLSESSPSRSVSVKNQNQKKNQNPLSSFLANIFGGKKEGMENEGNPAYPGKEGEEDQWILKSKIVPPVCPKCPEPTCDTKKCPPCPSCERCPEPAFECKKVPNYRSTNDNYLPRPVLADFSQFGM